MTFWKFIFENFSEGYFERSFWKVILEGHSGKSFWKLILEDILEFKKEALEGKALNPNADKPDNKEENPELVELSALFFEIEDEEEIDVVEVVEEEDDDVEESAKRFKNPS